MVIDLQDIGTRFYTYMTTMAYVIEEALDQSVTGHAQPAPGDAVSGALDPTAYPRLTTEVSPP